MQAAAYELFPYLCAFYVADAFLYLRPQQWLLLSLWPLPCVLRTSGLRLVGLVPTAEVAVCEDVPAIFTPQGLFLPGTGPAGQSDDDAEGELLPFEAVECGRVEGRTVALPGRPPLKAPSARAARRLLELVAELRPLPPARRLDHLEATWTAATDLDAVLALRARQGRWRPYLHALSGALWLGTFVLLPAGLYTSQPWRPDVRWLLPALVAAGLASAAVAYVALRDCGLERRDALAALMPLFLFPPAALHMSSFVWRDLHASFDRLAVSAAHLRPQATREAARAELRRLIRARDRAAGTAQEGYWHVRERACRRLLARLGLEPEALLSPRPSLDPSAVSYCPVCDAEYRRDVRVCADCDVALEAFETNRTEAALTLL